MLNKEVGEIFHIVQRLPKPRQKTVVEGVEFMSPIDSLKIPNLYGIEIEMEGTNLPSSAGIHWNTVRDGSLRACPEANEYVFKEAKKYSKAVRALELLYNNHLSEASLSPSYRCSVHIHLNVTWFKLARLYNLVTLYYILESMLFKRYGQKRQGNLFCLSLKDSPLTVKRILKGMISDPLRSIFHNDYKYMALNYTSITKFGSIEFRLMDGQTNPNKIIEFLDLLEILSDHSKRFRTPLDIFHEFSEKGCMDFVRDLSLPFDIDVNFEMSGNNDDDMTLVSSGMWDCQDIIYPLFTELDIPEKRLPAHLTGISEPEENEFEDIPFE